MGELKFERPEVKKGLLTDRIPTLVKKGPTQEVTPLYSSVETLARLRENMKPNHMGEGFVKKVEEAPTKDSPSVRIAYFGVKDSTKNLR